MRLAIRNQVICIYAKNSGVDPLCIRTVHSGLMGAFILKMPRHYNAVIFYFQTLTYVERISNDSL